MQLRREEEVERKPVSTSIKDLIQYMQTNIQVSCSTPPPPPTHNYKKKVHIMSKLFAVLSKRTNFQ